MKYILANKHRIGLLLILFAVIVIYANSIDAGFVYDDQNFIVDNRPIKTWLFSRPWDFFARPEVAVWSGIYRPLRTLSFAIDYQLFGLHSAGYHIENLLLHYLNCILVYFLLLRLTRSRLVTFIATLLFAIHPVQIESVTWISSRADLLFSTLTLVCMLLYIKRSEAKATLSVGFALTLSSLYFIALLSKETAIALVPTLLLYDLCFLLPNDKRSFKSFVIERVLFYVTIGIVTIGYLALRFSLFENVSQKPFWGGSAQANFLTMVEATVYYFRLMIYPTDLTIDYSTYPIIQSWTDSSLLYPLIFFPLLGAILFFQLRRRHFHMLFFAGVFVLFLLPCWNIIPISAIIAERFLYFPMIGFCAIASYALAYPIFGFSHHLRTIALCCVAVICILLMILTTYRNNDWKTDFSLWAECVHEYPGNFKGHINLGAGYDERNQISEAITEYYKLLSVNPTHATAYYNLGNLYGSIGLFKLAEKNYLTATKIQHDYWQAYNNLGQLYVNLGLYDRGLWCYNKILVHEPDYAKAHYNIGMLYYGYYKNYDKALYHLMKSQSYPEFKTNRTLHRTIQDIMNRRQDNG